MFLFKWVKCIVLGTVGDEMIKKTKLFFVFSSAVCLMLGFYLGLNLKSWIYFNDDDDVSKNIYNYAIDRVVAESPARDRPFLREGLLTMRPDFFRSKEHDCVRFMPRIGQYGFISVYCINRTDRTETISHY